MAVQRRGAAGFSIVELMIVLVIIAVLLTVGIPSFVGFVERNRLKSAAEGLVNDLNFARSEAILRGVNGQINVVFLSNGTNTWCYGMTTATTCDCRITDASNANACVIDQAGIDTLKRVASTEYRGDVTMSDSTFASDTAGFTALRGLANAGRVDLSADGNTVRVGLTALGVVRICSGSSLGYPSCT